MRLRLPWVLGVFVSLGCVLSALAGCAAEGSDAVENEQASSADGGRATPTSPPSPAPSGALQANPGAVTLAEIAPREASATGFDLSLTIVGSGFTQGVVVYFGEAPLPTILLSSSTLAATVPAGVLSSTPPGPVSVSVANATGGRQGSLTFILTSVGLDGGVDGASSDAGVDAAPEGGVSQVRCTGNNVCATGTYAGMVCANGFLACSAFCGDYAPQTTALCGPKPAPNPAACALQTTQAACLRTPVSATRSCSWSNGRCSA